MTHIWKKKKRKENYIARDFPGGSVAKTLYSQCRESRFDPWVKDPWDE